MLVSFAGWGKEPKVIAPEDPRPPRREIAAETEISVYRYVKAADVYEVTITHETDVGPNVATPEDLQGAIGIEGKRDQFMKEISRDKSAIYVLKKPLPLLWDSEVAARKKRPGK